SPAAGRSSGGRSARTGGSSAPGHGRWVTFRRRSGGAVSESRVAGCQLLESSVVRSTTEVVDEGRVEHAPPAPATDNGPRPADKRGHRGRRWFLRLFLTVLVLLILAAIAIQLVLWSNLPKRLVLAQLQSQLGLRVQARSLTTGWLGNTNLRDVTLALPMAEQSFLDMPKMRVKHTTLFG